VVSTSRLEFVHLDRRSRNLELSFLPGFSDAAVTVRAGGRCLGDHRLAATVRVELPTDLPTGRVPVSLTFSSPRGVALKGATVRPRRPGKADVAEGQVFQAGWSTVEIVRPLAGTGLLVGSFVPPSEPAADQRFRVVVDDGSRAGDALFEWQAGETRRSGEALEFEAAVTSRSGFARIRLVSEGRGPAGRWSAVSLSSRGDAPPTEHEPAPEPPRVVVLYVMDALRADAIGHLGSDRGASPVLDRLASEGVSFTRHFSVAPNTPASTTALFTGWCAVDGGVVPVDGPQTLAESFAAAGYRTAAVTSNPYISSTYGLARGFESVDLVEIGEDFRRRAAPTPNESADLVHGAALDWIDSLAGNERAFLYLHTLHPHNPYTPPAPFPRLFTQASVSDISGATRTLVEIRDGEFDPSPADQQRLRALYAANLAYNDERLGWFLSQLESRFPRDEILLMLTSDHGEELFDHGGVLHGYTLYDEMVRVPLVVWWPSRLEPRTVRRGTDTLDVHTTLLSMVSPEGAAGTAGRPLWPVMFGSDLEPSEPDVRFAFAAGERPLYMARSSRWKMILAPGRGLDWGMGRGRGRTFDSEYVFDLERDPAERINVAGTPDPEVAWLRSRLREWVSGWRRYAEGVVAPVIDETTRQRLEALGYSE
jgi:arylsulfatase A-like enzyme